MTHLDMPKPGYYKIKMGKDLPWQAVAIVDATERDDQGKPLEDERVEASLDGRAVPYARVWPGCSKNPLSADAYAELLAAPRMAKGGNNPPPDGVLDGAAELAASAAFIDRTADMIDAVKRAISLRKKLDDERKAAIADQEAEIATLEAPYSLGMADLDAAKEMLLKALESRVVPGSKEKGNYATASWRIKATQAAVISDPAAVPREYCRPDPALVLEALRAGVVIPGCSIVETETRTLVVS